MQHGFYLLIKDPALEELGEGEEEKEEKEEKEERLEEEESIEFDETAGKYYLVPFARKNSGKRLQRTSSKCCQSVC